MNIINNIAEIIDNTKTEKNFFNPCNLFHNFIIKPI